LTIDGGAGDTVTLTNGGWTLTVVDDYNEYTTATLSNWTLRILITTGTTIELPPV
jgi:subtilisin-like proprotein convertase family protein